MVQYIHTPWRDRSELLNIRQQFYPSPPSQPLTDVTTAATTTAAGEAEQHHAVSRVSMWMQRGSCPHLVESTALLTAAILSDLHETRTGANSSSYAIRATYSAAFSRYVGTPLVQCFPLLILLYVCMYVRMPLHASCMFLYPKTHPYFLSSSFGV